MRVQRPLSLLAASLFGLLASNPAHAISNRIFMSTDGNNAGDCANPLTPCLTFAGALAQVNPGGEVIAEATGGYGPLTITQAVTISGPPGVVIYSGLSVSVNAPGANVVLRGLTIDGTGATANGINVQAVATLHVESCVITGFQGLQTAAGNGIFFGSAGNLFVTDTTIRGNNLAAIWIQPASGTVTASIESCRLNGNQYGLISDTGTHTTVRNSSASGDTSEGFLAQSGGELNVESCIATNDGVGVGSNVAGSTARVSNSTVTDNGVGIGLGGGTALSRGNNTVEGNGSGATFTGTYSAK